MTDYVPIACIDHERLEFAVLKRQVLKLVWQDAEGSELTAQAIPTNVYTRDAAEWIEFSTADGQNQRIRLDFIRSVKPV